MLHFIYIYIYIHTHDRISSSLVIISTYVALCAKWWISSDCQGSQVRFYQEVVTFPVINFSAHNIVGG